VRQEVQRVYEEQQQEARRRVREDAERRILAEREESEREREQERSREAARAAAAAQRPELSIAITDYFLPPACRTIPFIQALPGGRIRISYIVVPSYIETRFCPRPFDWR
jgi:hypothetical protein